jgi:hypothetical protein
LRAYLRISCNSAGIVVGCAGDQAGAKFLQEVFEERSVLGSRARVAGMRGIQIFGMAGGLRSFRMFVCTQKISSRSRDRSPGRDARLSELRRESRRRGVRSYRRFDFARVDRETFARALPALTLGTRWRRRRAGACAIPAFTATAPNAEPIDLATSVSTPAVSLAVSFTLRLTVFAVIAILLESDATSELRFNLYRVTSPSIHSRSLCDRMCEELRRLTCGGAIG